MTRIHDITTTIERSSAPVSLSELLNQHPSVAKRTLQRWLSQLTAEGKISAVGKGRARRYVINKHSSESVTSIPLSANSKDILDYINQPIDGRKPVGYQIDFLESYQPNQTWYLSESMRRQLNKMGDTQQTALPAGTYGRDILSRLLIDLSWASSQLEGNTYSLLDTRELIESGKVAEGKATIETQMILNHKSAIELLLENADAIGFNRFTLLNLHAALSENLLPNPADEGRIRSHSVEIGKSVFKPLSIPVKISEIFDLLLTKINKIKDPFEQSFFIMVHLPYLQPFADVNKRTSRIAANIPLIQNNLCPLTFLGVSEKIYSKSTLGVYEMTRVELLRDLFVWAYERSTQEYLSIKQELVEPDPLRLSYRDVIKHVIHEVVMQNDKQPLVVISECLKREADETIRKNLEALITEELRRIHEGVLARYNLRPSDFYRWKEKQDS